MKKRTYRAVRVKQVDVEKVREQAGDGGVVLGVDVGKEESYGWLRGREGGFRVVMKWRNVGESRQVVELLKGLGGERVEVAMEPSGRYGDPLRSLLWAAGISVFRVSPKRSHDAVEVFDGVPSSHDAKSAGIVAKLHVDGASQPWPERSEAARDLRAAVETMDLFKEELQRNLGRMESYMARYWPEIGEHLAYSRATFLALVSTYGGPREILAREGEARALMRKVGGHFLREEKIEEVLGSCRETTGVGMTAGESAAVRRLATHTRTVLEELREAEKAVERQVRGQESIEALQGVLGKMTAAVLVAEGGEPGQYSSGSHWQKSLGLNLKERSSGKHVGKLKITKRGSGKARRWLYFAALRLIQKDLIVRAWYQAKVLRDGGIKHKAIVAIMRKLVRALWHVAQGETFDSRKLFDARRLGLTAA